jgi:CheY-like chemotaxis protein
MASRRNAPSRHSAVRADRVKERGSRRRSSLAPHSTPKPLPIVLIADDDETTRLVLQRALTTDGCLAIPVDDGGEIWPILERENVRAIVLDLNMPGVNGWEVLRRLRDDFRFRMQRVRVIVLSGQADPESQRFALQLGATEFLAKPVDLDAIRHAVRPSRA